MRTNLAEVFAAGDCVETYHRLLDAPTYISLGTIAHKQGRVAGENAIGGDRIFGGALGTQSLKVFDLAIARTGLSDRDAREAKFDPVTVGLEANDHKADYPGATPLRVHLTGDRRTGRLLGGQILGNRRAEISKRIDIIATAIFQGASVDYLNDLDLSSLRRSAVHGIRSRWRPRLGARNCPTWLIRFRQGRGRACTQTGSGRGAEKFHPRAVANRPTESSTRECVRDGHRTSDRQLNLWEAAMKTLSLASSLFIGVMLVT